MALRLTFRTARARQVFLFGLVPLLFVTLFTGVALITIGRGRVARSVRLLWESVTTGGPDIDLIETFGRFLTVLTILLLDRFGLDYQALPVLTIVSAVVLLMVIGGLLVRRDWPVGEVIILLVAIAAHPVFLWNASSGAVGLMSGIAFFAIVFCAYRLEFVADTQSKMTFGLVLGALVLVDANAPYIILPIVTLLPFLYRDIQDRHSAVAAYLLVLMPAAIVFVSLLYLHVLLSSQPLGRMFLLWAAPLHGDIPGARLADWMVLAGGRPWVALGYLSTAALVTVPAIVIVAWAAWREAHVWASRGTAAIAILVPIAGGVVATTFLHLQTIWPALLRLLLGVACWLATFPLPARQRRIAVLLMCLGSAFAWFADGLWADAERRAWREALFAPGPVLTTGTGLAVR